MIKIVLFATGVLAVMGSAQARQLQSPTKAESCAAVPSYKEEELLLLKAFMVEPKQFKNLADLLKAVPPEAIATLSETQKVAAERQAKDWAWLCRYAGENKAILEGGVRPTVIFIGDSITENWKLADPSLFSPAVLDRGIGGQTTQQILLRFNQDVVALRPRIVHIMAGTNDASGSTGVITDETIVDNIRAMIEIAQANQIRVVLASITPSKGFVARPGIDPSLRIRAINRSLVKLAAEKNVTYVDYGPALSDSTGALTPVLGNDGLHPNRNGYALMRPLTEQALRLAGKNKQRGRARRQSAPSPRVWRR